jgi:ribosomal protein S18 acetylase RimI-like enzyme
VEVGGEMNRALVPAAALAVLTRPWILAAPRIRKTAWGRLCGMFGRREAAKPTPLLPMPTLSLVSICVDPQARGRNVGEQLMKAWEQAARQRGCASLRLSVYPHNAGARRFYERNGWVPFQEDVPDGHAMYYSKIF